MHSPVTGCSLTFAEIFILNLPELNSAASGLSVKELILNDTYTDSSLRISDSFIAL